MNKERSKWGRIDWLLLVVGLLPVIATLFLYNRLPEQMAVHFGIGGNPDGYQGKLSFILLFSGLVLGLPILMKVFRGIDPKKENYEKFGIAFEAVRVGITIVFSSLFGIVILYNLGYTINIQLVTLLGIGFLFLIIGNYMNQIRFNYFMGIRTPWTLANESVWRRTHRLAGPIWVVSGLIVILSAFLPGIAAVWVVGIAIGFAAIVPMVYSYVLFRNMQK